MRQLHSLLARRDAVAGDLQREHNRAQQAGVSDPAPLVQSSIEESITFLTKEIDQLEQAIANHIDNDRDLRDKKDLLQSIPGVCKRVSAQLTTLPAGRSFASAEQPAAYLGLLPMEWQSSTSVRA